MCKTVTQAALYYQRNKETREKVHKCPHCDYETTGPKQTLLNHIHAKHTKNEDKPYFCVHCSKGFAQASNYEKHMAKFHDEYPNVTRTREERKPAAYIICFGNKEPIANKTRCRFEFYKENRIIPFEKFGRCEYTQGKKLTQKDLHYDRKKGYITYTLMAEKEFLTFQEDLKRKKEEIKEQIDHDETSEEIDHDEISEEIKSKPIIFKIRKKHSNKIKVRKSNKIP